MFKLDTYYKRYSFYSLLFNLHLVFFIGSWFYMRLTGNLIYLSVVIYSLFMSLIFSYFSDKYFKKVYMYKRGYNKVITKKVKK